MADKILQTRIKQRYDTLANWQAVWETFIPLKGEVCIFEVQTNSTPVNGSVSVPQHISKTGDGTTTLFNLPWDSGIAADVYPWAKEPVKPTYTKADVGLGNVVNESKATMFASAALTGVPTAPTAASGTSTNQIATTEFVAAAINEVAEVKVNNAAHADTADNATNANYATNANHATTADSATNATNAVNAQIADKIGQSSVGSENIPVYIKEGTPTSISTIDVSHGGTNATNATDARTNLGVYSTKQVDDAIAALSTDIQEDYNETIIGLSVEGTTVTYIKGDGSTYSFETQDTNTTYSLGTDTVTGLTKLYATTGSAEDGTMTQKAIKTELDKKVGVTINSTTLIFTI